MMQFDHIVLNVEDIARSVDFYRQVMGFEIERWQEYLSGEYPFPIVRVNEFNIIDLFPKAMWQDQKVPMELGRANLNHFCLTMTHEEWQALRKRLDQYKVPIEVDAIERSGAQGMGISIYFRDPDNTLIEARYYP